MHYSIYIPKVSGANPAHLNAVGLGGLLRSGDAGPNFCEVLDRGPDGGHGLYIAWPKSEPVYRPGQLTWKLNKPDKFANLAGGQFWWGVNPAEPVEPDDLLRQQTLKGKPVRCGGHYWLIPNVLLLPHRFELNDQGDEIRTPFDEYLDIVNDCRWCYDTVKSHLDPKETGPLPELELRRYAIRMLSLNYRLFPELAYAMGLLNDANWLGVACQTVDFDTLVRLEEELKKKP